MDTERWRQLEYESLRQEILSLFESHRSTPRFFLPAAAGAYGIPFLLDRPNEIFLWSMSAGGAGLMLFVMSYTLFASVDGVRRIGSYIRMAIEPGTEGGLRWETFVDLSRRDQRGDQPT